MHAICLVAACGEEGGGKKLSFCSPTSTPEKSIFESGGGGGGKGGGEGNTSSSVGLSSRLITKYVAVSL